MTARNLTDFIFENTTCELGASEWREIEEAIQKFFNLNYLEDLYECKRMIDWMEKNSNSGLDDYYNREETNV